MGSSEFEDWLSHELQILNVDEDVFKPYIVSILSEEDDDEGKAEALDGIMGGMLESQDGDGKVKKIRNAILDKWRCTTLSKSTKGDDGGKVHISEVEARIEALDLGACLASITETQTATYNASRASANPSDFGGPDKSVKEAILAQYSGVVEEDEEEDGEGEEGEECSRNVNANAVAKAEQERREKAKAAAMAKREKDKEDREKQKKDADERKKKAQEKAAKGERRR